MATKTIAQFVAFIAFIASFPLSAESTCQQAIAEIVSAQGNVDVQSSKSRYWQTVQSKHPICPGDSMRTSAKGRATLRLRNQSVITLDQNTTITFSAPENDASWFVRMVKGISFFRSRQLQRLDVHTPFINAIHQGTEFMVAVGEQNAEISVFDGQVLGENKTGKILIDKGFKGVATDGQAPRIEVLKLKPEDAVQWALYYPPIVDAASVDVRNNNGLQAALTDYRQGNISQALEKLDQMPTAQQDGIYATLKAGLLLTVGRLDDANVLIQTAQRLQPNNSEALALQAIIAVVKNQQSTALALANQAVAANSNSATANVALSYAQQALFDLDKAHQATQAAIKLAPDNALAWARLAELQLSQGDHNAALASARKAQTLNPKLVRTHIVLGFVKLAETEINQAKQVFEDALLLDTSDPLARLGLGLAKIRQGDVEAGKTELETAVNLDPNDAVIRSYLGKAFYELRNKEYAGKEYEIAKAMDPKDPTPWFYDAILKQTINRPVEALHDMQTATELNDNRGVYRSRLLLDHDSAARSASLGRIYNDLGFQQRGLLEGWNSVNQDPSNYSAHRLLADNYAALPRHEMSRVSELLKAQLLQPVNITPVQPQTAESNILILDGLGPNITSFNEYNPLYTRNRFALQASGFYGSRDTISDEVVHSGVWDKFSYSLGQFHYQTDGFRPNNGQKRDAYNVFAQAQLTPDTDVQVELRRTEETSGDINQGFYFDKYSSNLKATREMNSVRGGLHHKFSENSDLLASIVHRSERNIFDLTDEVNKFGASGTQYEVQHLYRDKRFDLVGGFTYADQQGDLTNKNKYDALPWSIQDIRTEHGAFYLYSNIKLMPNLTMLAGVTQDFYQAHFKPLVGNRRSGVVDENPINPKFGLTWMPSKDTTVRFAAFRALKRGIIQKQTLEPTQVAGFNQFYDDRDGTISSRIGLGIDHKFNSRWFMGAEYSRRHVQTVYLTEDLNGITVDKVNWSEDNARAYVNWTPTEQIAVGANYTFEGLNRNELFFDNLINVSNLFTKLATHKAQLFGSFYHPSGFISKLSLSFVNQSGDFANFSKGTVTPDTSSFWLLDTELGYRLPNRHGLISLGIKNLLDEYYNYQGTDLNIAMPVQGRFLYGRLTLSF